MSFDNERNPREKKETTVQSFVRPTLVGESQRTKSMRGAVMVRTRRENIGEPSKKFQAGMRIG